MKINTEGVTAVIPLREQLAEKAHSDWAKWTAYMLACLNLGGYEDEPCASCACAPDHGPNCNIARWERHIDASYADLTPREQASDRKSGDATANLIATWLEEELERLEIEHAKEDDADEAEGMDEETVLVRSIRRLGYREAHSDLAKALRKIDK